jgi:hypothetical protein
VLASARKELGALRCRRIAGDRQPSVVHDAVGVEGLAAPHGGERCQHRADRQAGGLAEDALVAFVCRTAHIEWLRPRPAA